MVFHSTCLDEIDFGDRRKRVCNQGVFLNKREVVTCCPAAFAARSILLHKRLAGKGVSLLCKISICPAKALCFPTKILCVATMTSLSTEHGLGAGFPAYALKCAASASNFAH